MIQCVLIVSVFVTDNCDLITRTTIIAIGVKQFESFLSAIVIDVKENLQTKEKYGPEDESDTYPL